MQACGGGCHLCNDQINADVECLVHMVRSPDLKQQQSNMSAAAIKHERSSNQT